MEDLIVGALAVAIGLLFCFRGYLTLRVIIPIWGSFAGFVFGAGLVANVGESGFLRTAVGWFVGLGFAFLFGMLAYLYFELSVVLAMASAGFVLGSSLMVALGVTWSWVVVLVGVLAGTLLAVIAIVGDLPAVFLTIISALAGASVTVGGAMLLVGVFGTDELTDGELVRRLDDGWWWYAAYVVLVVAGVVSQVRAVGVEQASMRSAWADAGGREMRTR